MKNGVAADEEGVGPLAHESCEGRIDLAAGADVETWICSPMARAAASTSLTVVSVCGIGWIDEHGHTSGSGHQLAQEFQSLCRQLSR